jgi:WD40 repeat protein
MTHDAFISYSRKDRAFAVALQKALSNYTPPRGLPVPHRRLDVFRDEEDFTGAEYFQSVERHLTESTKLIVLCSPAARASQFVNDEIRRFARSRGPQHIIALLVEGIPNNEATPEQHAQMAFPEALCEVMQMPLAADYRDFDPARAKVYRGRYEASWYTTLANLYDLRRAQIEQREKKRRARRRQIALSVAAASVLILAGLTLYGWRQRQEAIQQARLSEARFLTDRVVANESMAPGQGLRVRALVAAESLRTAWTNEGYDAWRQATRQMPPIIGRIKTDSVLIRMAFSSDGKTLIGLCGKRHVHVLSVPDLRELKSIEASETAFEIAIDAKGERALAYKANDEFVEAIDIGSGNKRSVFLPGAFRAMLFTPAGEAVAAATRALWVLDAQSDRAQTRVVFPAGTRDVALSPDGATVLAMTGRELNAYDTRDGLVRWQTSLAGSNASSRISFSGDGRAILVSTATDVHIINSMTGAVLNSLPLKVESRSRPLLLSEHHYVVGNDVYAVAAGEIERELPFMEDTAPRRFPAVSPSGRYVAAPSKSIDESIAVVDLTLKHESAADDPVAFYLTLEEAHHGSAVAFTTSGDVMALSSEATGIGPDTASELQLVSLQPQRWRPIIPSRSRTGDLIVLPPDARVVAKALSAATARTFAADGAPLDDEGDGTFASQSGRYVARRQPGREWIITDTATKRRITVPDTGSPIEFSPDEQRVMVFPEIYSLDNPASPQKVAGADPFLVSWSFPGSNLVIGIDKNSGESGDSKQSVLFDWQSGSVTAGPGSVHRLYAVSPDGRHFATYDYDAINIWTAGATTPVVRSGRVSANYDTPLQYNHDGTLLAVAKCGSVPIYDAATLELRFDVPIGNACFAGFTVDGTHLVSRRWHGSVPEPTLHPLTIEGVLEETCARVLDNLTSREWDRLGAPARTTCPER